MLQLSSYSLRNRRLVCNIIFISTYTLLAILSAFYLIGLGFGGKHMLLQLIGCGIAFLYVARAQTLAHQKRIRVTAYMLVGFCLFSGICALLTWGANSPVSVLTFGLAVLLAGVLLEAACALHTAVVASMLLVGAQVAVVFGWTFHTHSANARPSLNNILVYCTAFGLLALVALFYDREMHHSSNQVEEAEAALSEQKSSVNKQVKKRTSQLEQMQLEEIQHMYRFAELGQLGVTLLHDLANHLTTLTLEIEGIQNKQHTEATDRAHQIIHYLESTVDSTRDRLHGSTQRQPFNIIGKTTEAIAFLNYKADRAGIRVEWKPPARSWTYIGDPAGYSQVIAILTSNAIDAYASAVRKKISRPHDPCISVTMEKNQSHIIIHVNDWGKGISKRQQKQLFKPFRTTKKTGMGIGLFMAKQTLETTFSGTLTLNPRSDHTDFVIMLPLGK